MRKSIYFEEPKQLDGKSVSCGSLNLYPQEQDWTCSLACIRSLLSGVSDIIPSEYSLISKFKLTPGPYYSKDIKSLGIIDINKYNVVFGCDKKDVNINDIRNYLSEGYYIMLESMINYGHWMVLLGYYLTHSGNPETSKIVMYDPYYDKVRTFIIDEFIGMWQDGDYLKNGVYRDFIAIKTKHNYMLV